MNLTCLISWKSKRSVLQPTSAVSAFTGTLASRMMCFSNEPGGNYSFNNLIKSTPSGHSTVSIVTYVTQPKCTLCQIVFIATC